MKFGIGIPTGAEGMYVPCGFAGPKDIAAVAKLCERLGFYSVWGADFFTPTPSLEVQGPHPPNFYEVLITLSYLASITHNIRLGAGAVMLPLRDPVLLAKQLSTLDVLSSGRLLFGVGIGANRDQFEMVMPRLRKAHRASMMIEILQSVNLLVSEDNVSFKGEYYQFDGVSLNPKPVQNPIPIYIAGRSPKTLGRVVKWGSGWLLSRMQSVSVADKVQQLHGSLHDAGRDTSSVDVVVTKFASIEKSHEKAVKRFQESMLPRRTALLARRTGAVPQSVNEIHKHDLVGSPEEIMGKIDQLRTAGATHCVALHFAADTFDEMMEQVQMFGEEVVSKF